mmetsp:Transcript_33961/g.60019  ORF Transcript_33961/g.60019 Transcript_33961/m.60019 type:complete len:227 (-) Transcript_33961:135-815(-)
MPSMRDQCIDWAIKFADQGGSWWMPLVLLSIVAANALTGGVFIWCLGILQATIFPMVVLSNKRVGIILGPVIMTLGSSIAAVTYIKLMQSGGAEVLLQKSGAKESTWLAYTQYWANNYGAWGLLGLQIAPIPIPTAVAVTAGMLAGMNATKVFCVLMTSKFVQLTLGAIAMKYGVAEGKTAAEYIRENFKPEEGNDKDKNEDGDDDENEDDNKEKTNDKKEEKKAK